MIFKEQNNQKKILIDGLFDGNYEQESVLSINGKRFFDGFLSYEDFVKVLELQEVIDRQVREQSQMKECLVFLFSYVVELEEDLDIVRKDFIKFEEMNMKLQ